MKIDQPLNNRSLTRSVVIDAFVLAGIGLVTYGAWLVYAPAGFIVPGVLLLALGLGGRQ